MKHYLTDHLAGVVHRRDSEDRTKCGRRWFRASSHWAEGEHAEQRCTGGCFEDKEPEA